MYINKIILDGVTYNIGSNIENTELTNSTTDVPSTNLMKTLIDEINTQINNAISRISTNETNISKLNAEYKYGSCVIPSGVGYIDVIFAEPYPNANYLPSLVSNYNLTANAFPTISGITKSGFRVTVRDIATGAAPSVDSKILWMTKLYG